ncbi:transketolase [Chitinophaga flava]|uniref:Transketolase n=1 Tax=Chitinophaga flava TaxID=2259036 RepID=A0A365XT93_9BACT|nr:transketolase [Chitinophaga flava]RBL88934.1 transketolase [Chitinophaga flava]
MKTMTIEEKCIDTIRCLAMDAVQKANSGHPGTPMALAPAAFVLWTEHLRFNPQHPGWLNRDRFVLSNGHASMLQYAVLHLTGYDISLDDLKQFRQWGSNTPGHPEYRLTPGIETTTGPLGQGIMTAVGMAMAEAHLAALFNRDDAKIIDHYTYVFCSDGDLMEGASHEAASIAGHQGLGKLICLYDNNHITIEGNTSLTYSDDVAKRFEAYHWHVQDLGDNANDLKAISAAFEAARAVTDKPSMILLRSHIGYGSPHKQDTPEAHGSPLGADEIRLTKAFYGWPEDQDFLVPEDVKAYMGKAVNKGKDTEQAWNALLQEYKTKYPDLYQQLEQFITQKLPAGWDHDVPVYKPEDGPKATREISSAFLNAVASKVPWLIGGSGDLEPSTLTLIKSSGYFEKGNYANRNIAWGIREHVMCAATSGLQLHGGVRAYAATFFIFTDYARPAIRLACIMELPVIYVMTHDSIGLGEDGTTHQPVEHLASLRAMPHMCVIRPGDANEAAWAWRTAITRTGGPTMLVLTRQKLPIADRSQLAPASGLQQGAYILAKENGDMPDIILIATGSEVSLVLEARERLQQEGIDARVVSMPSWELFREQSEDYRQQVLPPAVKARLAVEAGSPEGWEQWLGEKGTMIGISHFGSSAPAKELFKHYGFTVENILDKATKLVKHEKAHRI